MNGEQKQNVWITAIVVVGVLLFFLLISVGIERANKDAMCYEALKQGRIIDCSKL